MSKEPQEGKKTSIKQLFTLVEAVTSLTKGLDLDADPKAYFNAAIQIYEEFIETFKGGGKDEAAFEASEDLQAFENIELHIAITGEAGSGKSSFINAIRGLSAEDDEAAPVGVTETTRRPTSYKNCKYPNVMFWDLPGIGSPGFPPECYLEKVKFFRYDFFIIVGSERWRRCHIELAKEILQRKKKCYFVRSNVDSDLDNMERNFPKENSEKQVIEMIRQACKKKMEMEGHFGDSSPPIFLTSCWRLDKYDFPVLVETLTNDLPSLKRLAFELSLPNFSPEIIAKKKADVKKDLWKISLVSACINAIPIPEVPVACDIALLLLSMVAFYKKFELDDNSLARLAKRAKKPLEELKAVIKSPQSSEITRDVIVKKCIDYVHQILSKIDMVTSSLVSAGLSFAVTYWMLSSFLDNIAEDAERVHNKIMEVEVCEAEAPCAQHP